MLAWMKGRLTRAKPGEFLDSPWEYWECVAMECPKSLLPKLAIRVLSVAVNTATCERLFSELGMIHTAKRNRMNSSEALDFHTIAKHVRQRLRKEAVASKNPKKKLLISPKERNIILDAATRSSLFTPSPQQHAVVNTDADSDDEDPGDGVDGPPTFALWGEYLKEVFEDGEIEADYAGNGRNTTDADAGASTGHNATDDSVRVSREQRYVRGSRENDSDSENDNEFEEIPAAIKHAFTEENDRRFPQEPVKLQRFRGQKETLAKLFG
ncbi:hypothetical protein PF008_g14202 [Phytophthora fragariae]|uniref:HAT C-terminal dimerisation domain-containing protein n=1 Tax=Phytophthora fragariae TaxID=53985 RepID=A0A6G0RIK3_9STRA|nr:hypothetical protein PF008_g14202 [Phytophthora fragariae]